MYCTHELLGGEKLTALGIPFCIRRSGGRIQALENAISLHGKYSTLYFLGMSVNSWMCSEWWGQQEVAGDYSDRLFIGDLVAKIHILYADKTQDSVPVLFGVNCWNYNLYFRPQPWEDASQSFEAPYDEPMRSDPAAQTLFETCLRMRCNDDPNAEKASRWVFAYHVRPKEITGIRVDPVKAGGVAIGGVTASTEPAVIPCVDEEFFLRKDWFMAADALSRRLYQYRDALPSGVDLVPLAVQAPDIRFEGDVEADIYTNVYRANVADMVTEKVTDDGMPHTSSKNTVNFGLYVGLGTYAPCGSYASHVWTRDTGRLLIELIQLGRGDRAKMAVDKLHEMLYYPSVCYHLPHWKRIANLVSNVSDITQVDSNEFKENDGHASIMMAIYALYRKGNVDLAWLKAHRQQLWDAASFYLWQIANPEQSNFHKVLCSESEASSQQLGGYDLYSNVISAYALLGYSHMFLDMGEDEQASELRAAAETILHGVDECFTMSHPRFGSVYTDTTDDCWTYEYKRFCHALMQLDVGGYDLAEDDAALFDRLQRTFDAQKEWYYHPESGRQMGYGQGYLTLSALLLDRQQELSDCMHAIAHFCYHHTDFPYIVPEGVIMDVQRKRWFRNCDLGNAVQQAEIVKCARVMVGLDDLNPARGLRIVPRLPLGWNRIRVADFPVRLKDGSLAHVGMEYSRCTKKTATGIAVLYGDTGYCLTLHGVADSEWEYARFGPFEGEALSVVGGKIRKIRKIQGNYYAYVEKEGNF